jgi:hypothetical protein
LPEKRVNAYGFAESLFSYTGNVVFANVAACRELAHRINKVRDVEKHPEQVVHAGQLYAMGLIDEASHVLMARYREQFDPAVMTSALEFFSGKVGAEALDAMLLAFVEQFPGISVIRGIETPRQWLEKGSRRARPTGLRRSKNCCCSGPPTATRLFSPFRNSSRKRPWRKRPFTAGSRASCPTTLPPVR